MYTVQVVMLETGMNLRFSHHRLPILRPIRPPVRRSMRFGALACLLLSFEFLSGCQRNRVEVVPVPSAVAAVPELASISTSDGGTIEADRYGSGDRAVVLAHGARFDKESWKKQARALAAAGFQVLAIDFRGYGRSRGGKPGADPHADLELDVLAAVRWLRARGAKQVSVVGGSMGGGAAALASTLAATGEIDRLVLIAAPPIEHPERMTGKKLFVVSRDDRNADGSPRLQGIRDQYDRAANPKELLVLEGSAHAQFIFDSDQGERLLDAIVRFLSAP